MKENFTEEDIKNIAAQLRKPEGKNGIEIGKRMNIGNAPMNLHTLAVLNPQANDNILELGMGNGHFVKNITNLDTSIIYTGCDYSALMVEEASKINKELIDQKRASFVYADANDLPFENNSFSKIFTVNTFYFWNNHNTVLTELKRVLKKGGALIISIRPSHNLEKFPVTKYDFSIFSQQEILDLLNDNGFNSIEVTEIKEPNQPHFGGMGERECTIFSCSL